MKKLLLISLLSPLLCTAQKIGDGVMNMYNSVGIITYTHRGEIESGTGTLMYKGFEGGGMKIFLITCGHVLPHPDTAKEIKFIIRNDSSKTNVTTLIIAISDSLKKYSPYVKFDPFGNDLAVIDITEMFIHFPLSNLQTKPIPYTLLAIRDSLSEYNVHVGDYVLFAGYPSFFFDKRNVNPVMRQAVISTPPQDSYYFNDIIRFSYLKRFGSMPPDKLDGFLIDGNAIGGSSGSLVFLRPQFLRNKDGDIERNVTTTDPMVLGILSDSYIGITSNDSGRINIGGVISSDAIKRAIDSFK